MGKSSKKGRLTGGQRKEINQRIVNAVLDDDPEDMYYGRVLRHLGAGNIRVMLPNKTEGIAKIRNILARRGSTPIVSGDIVILSGREFETLATKGGELRYDVMAVMTKQEAAKLEQRGKIPAWMLTTGDVDKEDDGDQIFDYTGVEYEGELNDSDIDDI